jgi:regulator of sigma E protease
MSGSPGVLITIFGFLAVIGPLIFVHELGHYLVGRWFGVHAEAFSIGMGRELFGWNDRRGTRWRVAALPIGGYVKFAGDMGPASAADPAWLKLPPEERARTFQGKPVWQRFLIVAAGPVTNFLVAIVIFAGFFAVYGEPQTPPVVAHVIEGSAAQKGGIRPGDRFLEVNGHGVGRFEDIAREVAIRPGERIRVEIERGGRIHAMTLVAGVDEQKDRFGNVFRRGLLGVAPGGQEIVRLGPVQVLGAAVRHTGMIVTTMVETIGQIVTGRRSAKELGGPLQIAKFSGERVSLGWLPFVEFMALISINLGFINLLPIPLLDGGHLFFYLVEGIRRRPLPARAQEWAFRSGLALLLGFMLFVTMNDLGSFGLWAKLAGLIG